MTVGTQEPFDRLIRTVDRWAGEHGRDDVLAQIGIGGYVPRSVRWVKVLTPEEFRKTLAEAKAVVAHAGIGTILSALELHKPVLVMPRSAALREQRSDHQVETARRLRERGRIVVAEDEYALLQLLEQVESLAAPEMLRCDSSSGLFAALRGFLHAP